MKDFKIQPVLGNSSFSRKEPAGKFQGIETCDG
jgi:hypothetical protein